MADEQRPRQPLQSPISTPHPWLGQESIRPGPPTRREKWGYVFWLSMGAAVAVPEIIAAASSRLVPFPTISFTAGTLERHHPWIAILILGGIVTLTARIVFYPWPRRTPEED